MISKINPLNKIHFPSISTLVVVNDSIFIIYYTLKSCEHSRACNYEQLGAKFANNADSMSHYVAFYKRT